MFKVHRSFYLTTGVKNNSIAVFNPNIKEIVVMYHKTIVVHAKYVNGKWKAKLNDGGWSSVSTCFVINNALDQIPGLQYFRVYRKNGVVRLDCSGFDLGPINPKNYVYFKGATS